MWAPTFGAVSSAEGVRFTLWAPEAGKVEMVSDDPGGITRVHPLERNADELFQATVSWMRCGDLYRYRICGKEPYPDPASRFQPEGVHGPSEIIDPGAFSWTDDDWPGLDFEDTVLYEMHVGTFSPEGTFKAATERLPWLKDLGITAIELMPLADFPGQRNWGYDGVALFAPARCYGRPDDLRRFVNQAHRVGLAVYVDVVYNHFGPDGAYATAFSPQFLSQRHESPWGAGINLDDAGSQFVRRFFIENALHWIHEYHVDGLRLDATHVLIDDSPTYFLAELSAEVRASLEGTGRKAHLVAEDTRNQASMLLGQEQGGWQLDGVWSDDFHHEVRRHLTGDSDGYYVDFTGSMEDVAATVRQGWFFTGQYAPHFGRPRGTDPSPVELSRFAFFIQNHDQIGNRAFGDRLNHAIEPAAFRAISVLLLLAPETPLIFMGQEWAASTPFQFFTDHCENLGRLVTAGRRREFAHFASFADPQLQAQIPDPQSLSTFEASKLVWEERTREPHASTLRLYKQLLELRRREPALRSRRRDDLAVRASDDATLVIVRNQGTDAILVVLRTKGTGYADVGKAAAVVPDISWIPVLSTEDLGFTEDPAPIRISGSPPVVEFQRPGAVILRRTAF
jgi:maltooligosyltrehalose trehalohydrolase